MRRYEPLVRRVVWQVRPPLGCEREDLAQEARIGLVAAIRAWRSERGPFPAFAERCVRNQTLLGVKAAGRHKHQLLGRAVRLDDQHGGDSTPAGTRNGFTLLETLAVRDAHGDPEARLLVREQLTSVARALPTLTDKERRALVGALNDQSYADLGVIIGGTPKAASQAACRARRKLAAVLPRAA